MIDKIDGLGPVRLTQPVKRAARSGGSEGASFARQLDESAEAAPGSGVAAASSVSGILGVQEVDDALAHAARGKARAQDILDRLDDLRVELLGGSISKEKLLQLGRIVASRRAQINDPKLLSILDDIDLRAQVELAKWGDRSL